MRKRIIACLTALSFIFVQPQLPGVFAAPSAVNAETDFKIPVRLGRVLESFHGASGKFVVYIQDAHANYDAQNSICGLIDYFQKKKGISFVGLEGGEGLLDLTVLRAFPNQKLKEKVLDEYVRRGELTGAELAAVVNEMPAEYVGLENAALYRENKKAFLAVLGNRDRWGREIQKIRTMLDQVSVQVESPELRELRNHPRETLARFTKDLKFDTKKITNYNQFIQDIKEKIFRSTEERELDLKFQHLEAIERISRLEAMREDVLFSAALLKEFKIDLKPALRFYELAFQRDQVMAHNLISRLKTNAILITGGFHTEGIKEKLRQAGISYILIQPRIQQIGTDELYLKTMRGDVSYAQPENVEKEIASAGDDDVKILMRRKLQEWRMRLPGFSTKILPILDQQLGIAALSPGIKTIDNPDRQKFLDAVELRLLIRTAQTENPGITLDDMEQALSSAASLGINEDAKERDQERLRRQALKWTGSDLWQEFVRMNNGENPTVLSYVGFSEKIHEELDEALHRLIQEGRGREYAFVMIQLRNWQAGSWKYAIVFDRVKELVDPENFDSLSRGAASLKQFDFVISFVVYDHAPHHRTNEIYISEISIGKEGRNEPSVLRGKGYMRQAFKHLAEYLEEEYPGKSISTKAIHYVIAKWFAEHFEAKIKSIDDLKSKKNFRSFVNPANPSDLNYLMQRINDAAAQSHKTPADIFADSSLFLVGKVRGEDSHASSLGVREDHPQKSKGSEQYPKFCQAKARAKSLGADEHVERLVQALRAQQIKSSDVRRFIDADLSPVDDEGAQRTFASENARIRNIILTHVDQNKVTTLEFKTLMEDVFEEMLDLEHLEEMRLETHAGGDTLITDFDTGTGSKAPLDSESWLIRPVTLPSKNSAINPPSLEPLIDPRAFQPAEETVSPVVQPELSGEFNARLSNKAGAIYTPVAETGFSAQFKAGKIVFAVRTNKMKEGMRYFLQIFQDAQSEHVGGVRSSIELKFRKPVEIGHKSIPQIRDSGLAVRQFSALVDLIGGQPCLLLINLSEQSQVLYPKEKFKAQSLGQAEIPSAGDFLEFSAKEWLGAKLWKVFTFINQGHEPHVLHLAGTLDELAENRGEASLRENLEKVKDDEFVLLIVHNQFRKHELKHLIVFDRASELKRRDALATLLYSEPSLGQFEFVLHLSAFDEINHSPKKRNVSLDRISFGKDFIPITLRGKGIVSDAFRHVVTILEKKYAGWNMVTSTHHFAVAKWFLEQFDARLNLENADDVKTKLRPFLNPSASSDLKYFLAKMQEQFSHWGMDITSFDTAFPLVGTIKTRPRGDFQKLRGYLENIREGLDVVLAPYRHGKTPPQDAEKIYLFFDLDKAESEIDFLRDLPVDLKRMVESLDVYKKVQALLLEGRGLLGGDRIRGNSLGDPEARKQAVRLLTGKMDRTSMAMLPREIQLLMARAGVIPDEEVDSVIRDFRARLGLPTTNSHAVILAIHTDSLPEELSESSIRILSSVKKLILVFPQENAAKANRIFKLIGADRVMRMPYVGDIPIQDIQRALDRERGMAKAYVTPDLLLVADQIKKTKEKISYFEFAGARYPEPLAAGALEVMMRIAENPEVANQVPGLIRAASLGNGETGISFDIKALLENLSKILADTRRLAQAA